MIQKKLNVTYPGYSIYISIEGLSWEAEDADVQDEVHHVTPGAAVRVSTGEDHVPQGVHVTVPLLEILYHLDKRWSVGTWFT